MVLTGRTRTVRCGATTFAVRRTTAGVVEVSADDEDGLAAATGYAHAHDRLVQMELTRLAGRGALSRCLRDDGENRRRDRFMLSLGLHRLAERDARVLEAEDRPTFRFAAAYAAGVNHWLDRHRRPLELLLARHRPARWTVADTLLVLHATAYLGLAQGQQTTEKLIVQAIRQGADIGRLKLLFDPHLDGLTDETVAAVRELELVRPAVDADLSMLPGMACSNNWAIAGTGGRGAVLAFDPHLEVGRLPNVWSEIVAHLPHEDRIGVTLPGVPGVPMGRGRTLAWSFTYGMMDTIDYFLERVVGGRCRRQDGDVAVTTNRDTVGADEVHHVHRTPLGLLEGGAGQAAIADGVYLCRAWTGETAGMGRSLRALRELMAAGDVAAGQDAVRAASLPANWLFAGADGRIGYQQSGAMPRRRHSGLHPVPAWHEANHWQGLVDPRRLRRTGPTGHGFLATANDVTHEIDGRESVNLPMSDYRRRRIADVLAGADATADPVAASLRLQGDVVSTQAARLMERLGPLLPRGEPGDLLRGWDGRYTIRSDAATLFELVYRRALELAVGCPTFGAEGWQEIADGTTLVTVHCRRLDALLLGEDSRWQSPQQADRLLARAVAETFAETDPETLPYWGGTRLLMMTNLFWGGRLSALRRVDHGPLELPGSRATVVQGALHHRHGRPTSLFPGYRFVTDMGGADCRTALAGGPSGRITSPWYLADVDRWRRCRHKTLRMRG